MLVLPASVDGLAIFGCPIAFTLIFHFANCLRFSKRRISRIPGSLSTSPPTSAIERVLAAPWKLVGISRSAILFSLRYQCVVKSNFSGSSFFLRDPSNHRKMCQSDWEAWRCDRVSEIY